MSGYISPDTYGFDQTVVFVTMLVLGGAGSLLGCVLGAVLLTFLPEWLRGLKDYYLVIYGVSVLLLMVFLPSGIVGLLRGAFTRQPSTWGPVAPAGVARRTHPGEPTLEAGDRGAGSR